MSTESIKKLVEYEKEAKEMIEEANRRYEEMKRQASIDAKEVVKLEKEKNEKKLEDIKEDVDKFIKILENQKKDEFDEKIRNLHNFDGKDKLVNELLIKICKK